VFLPIRPAADYVFAPALRRGCVYYARPAAGLSFPNPPCGGLRLCARPAAGLCLLSRPLAGLCSEPEGTGVTHGSVPRRVNAGSRSLLLSGWIERDGRSCAVPVPLLVL
jgi:hypothetical protein